MKVRPCPNPRCRKAGYLQCQHPGTWHMVFRVKCSNPKCQYVGPEVHVRESSDARLMTRIPAAQQRAYEFWNALPNLTLGQIDEIERDEALRQKGLKLAEHNGRMTENEARALRGLKPL